MRWRFFKREKKEVVVENEVELVSLNDISFGHDFLKRVDRLGYKIKTDKIHNGFSIKWVRK